MKLDKRISHLEEKLIKQKPAPVKIIRVFIDPSPK
jgi:hypothetical protein|tara:strand:+ start:349 stop:453 length:105 start_codon:yes stop_codon:yes gene_type:complete